MRASTYVFGFLFYLAAVLLGVSLATSIVEEKQNRIVEIIASPSPLRDLLVGKIVGNTVIALARWSCFSRGRRRGSPGRLGRTRALRQITGRSAGSWSSTPSASPSRLRLRRGGRDLHPGEDIQSTTTPSALVVAVVFIAGISASGTFQTVLSFLPLSSTIAMPGRVVAGDAAWWEPVLALLISLAAAVRRRSS